jgi:ligand-binding sensor domain-containing protein
MDGHLSGIEGAENYVVITDLMSDDQGYMWFLNSHSGSKQSLHVYDLDSSWEHWNSADGIRSVNVSCFEIDHVGRIWIGTGASNGMGANGVSVVDDNDSPFDKSDDDLSGFLDEAEGLESNNITALAEDLDGTMWIGTTKGLNYWFGTLGARYSVINDNIQALYVDPRNNKWIGTAGGLSVLDSDNFSWKHYTTSNSQLVSDIITSLAFDEETGELYIGTTNGLSRFETPYTKPASNLNAVKGYPNPFVVDPENARFYIDNLALNSNVNIYTADGFLVKEIPRGEILGARVSWDGTNDNGDPVASGVYIYLVTTKDGQTKSGKIALVRQ